MKKEFVPYELAVKLKELRYNQNEYLNWYNAKGNLQWDNEYIENDFSKNCCSAPLFQQAFRWLREKGYRFNMINDVSQVDGDYFYDVWFNGNFIFESHYIYKTYEEAELACLTKLIEIVEQTNN